MKPRNCLAIVLAAGEGTRMRSSRPKVLHAVAAQSLLAHVLGAVRAAEVSAAAVVIGPEQEEVAAEALRIFPDAAIAVQQERRGTAHAVLAAKSVMERETDDILIVYGDTPLLSPASLTRLRAPLADGAAVAVLGFRPTDPTGYGRLVMAGEELIAIREEADATPSEKAIGF